VIFKHITVSTIPNILDGLEFKSQAMIRDANDSCLLSGKEFKSDSFGRNWNHDI
jgi:hypothetical protein